jgi:putative membrane protein
MKRAPYWLICGALIATGCAQKSPVKVPAFSSGLPPAVGAPATEAFAPMTPGGAGTPTRAPLPETIQVATQPRDQEYTTDFPLGTGAEAADQTSGGLALSESAVAQPAFSNAQILEIAATVDEGEIAQAKVIQKRSENPPVKEFARHMQTQHTLSKRDANYLAKTSQITPEESALARDIKEEGERKLNILEKAAPRDVDRVYLSSQIDQHTRVLQLLDAHLIPNATDAELRAQLEQSRAMVARHLAEAQEMWRELEQQKR